MSLCLAASGIPTSVFSADVQDDRAILSQWHGIWHGHLETLPVKDDAPPVKVLLEIGVGDDDADGCLTWRSTYFEDREVRQVKDYRFCHSEGRYFIDEGDGLELDISVFGNTLYSAFRVRDVLLITRYRVDGDRMFEEIFFAPIVGQVVGDVESRDIESYAGRGMQRIEFTRGLSDK